MRRKIGQKRKIEELEGVRDILYQPLETLLESSNNKTMQLVNLIRSKASIEEIRLYMEQELPRHELEKTPELMESHSKFSKHGRSARRVLDVKRLAHNPVYKVPAKPWTTVTDDDECVASDLAVV